MRTAIELFYNEKFRENVRQGGILGYLYHKLRGLEIHRYDVVTRLAVGNDYGNILDIGCHRGDLLGKISEKCKCGNIFGIDIYDEGLNVCRKKFPQSEKNFFLRNIDDATEFPADFFDLITMVAVLEHVFDPLAVVKEIGRIVKPEGSLIVEVPNIAFIKYRLDLLFGKRPRTSWDYGWDGGHLQSFTKNDLEALLKQNGFAITNSTGSGIFLHLRKWYPSLLLPNIIIKAVKN